MTKKKEKEPIRYEFLEIRHHDNDVTQHYSIALEQLWTYIHKNAHAAYPIECELFLELYEGGVLNDLILRLANISRFESNVEFVTRGLGRLVDSRLWEEDEEKKKPV